jgi:hypothetical protein
MAAMRNTPRGDFPGGGRAAVAGHRARTVTGLAQRRATGPSYFAGERLKTGDPRIARHRLGSIQSNLHPAGVERIKRSVAQGDVTEGFQQATGEILQAPEQLPGRSSILGRRGAQQAADLQDLQDDVRNLEQVIIRFEQFRVGAESVFQVQAAVLLTIESLVLNVPAVSSPFRGNVLHLANINVKIRDPSERRGFTVNGFFAFDGVKAPNSPLVILIGQGMNPAVNAANAIGSGAFPSVFGTKLEETLKVFPDGGHVP